MRTAKKILSLLLLSVALCFGTVSSTVTQSDAQQVTVESVQGMIDALPGADEITVDNAEEVSAQLDAIDEAKAALADEEIEQLDPTRYMEAVAALEALAGQAGASTPMPVDVATGITYLDEKVAEQTCSSATVVTASDTTWNNGWYVVNSTVTITERITVSGTVHLILADGASLTASKGIKVDGNNKFYIYGQSASTGTLTATGGDSMYSGIGNNNDGSGGTIVINGGTINATGGSDSGGPWGGAGIGSGYNGKKISITINGGNVTATGGIWATGIGHGGGVLTKDATITINGGTVTAAGDQRAAGIGGGSSNACVTVIINGGVVEATGAADQWGHGGAGIGAGYHSAADGAGASGNIAINGGIVTATGGDNAAGIGGGNDKGSNSNIAINGGLVKATAGSQTNGLGSAANIGGGGKSNSEAGTEVDESNFNNSTVFKGNTGTVYGDATLSSNYTIPNGDTLTIPSGTTLTIEEDVTLTNNGTITNNGIIQNHGTIIGNVGGNGIVLNERSNIQVTLSPAAVTYGGSINITATIKKDETTNNLLSRRVAVDYVDFLQGNMDSVTKLNNDPIQVVNGTATLSNVSIIGNDWTPGAYTITAVYGGGTSEKLLENTGTATLTVNAIQLSAPDNLQWDSTTPGKVTWNTVANASGYSVQLYNGEQTVGSAQEVTDTSCTFNITTAGSYTFKVTAKGTGNYSDSQPSSASAALTYYAVTFNTGNGGSAIDQQIIISGGKVNKPTDPTKAGHDFKGWYSNSSFNTKWNFDNAISGTTTLYAKWEAHKHTITWKNDDGTVLETDSNVEYGTTPNYDGATPTKAATAQYTYIFAGWTPTVSTVTGDATYTATYTATVNQYTVTWKNEDDTVLETDNHVEYGTNPTYDGTTPTKAATAQYTYSFKGWDKEIAAVTGDVTYTATYTATVNKYTITWQNADSSQLKTDSVAYGQTPAYVGDTPTKADDATYTYTHSGWEPEITAVTSAATYKATYSKAYLAPAEKTGFTIDYTEETAKANSGYEISTDNSVWHDSTADALKIVPGGTLYVRKAADADASASEATRNTLDERPAAPTGLSVVNEKWNGEGGGQITGVSSDMEYRLSSASKWTPCDGTTVDNLAAGSYKVRLKATNSAFTSVAADVTIASGTVRTYTLNVTAPTFDPVTYGDPQPDAKGITISSSGNSDATITGVALSGAGANSFTLNKTDGATITAGATDKTTYTIQPNTKLDKGAYTATITVSYNGGAKATATVTFIVNSAAQTAPSEPKIESNSENSITLQEIAPNGNGAAAEYRINSGAWQTSRVFSGLSSNTSYSFEARYAATGNYDASPASSAASFATKSSSGGSGSSTDSGSSYDYYTIIATAGSGGTISPSGRNTYREGQDITYTITPNNGYVTSDVLVDGKSIGTAKTYTFANIQGAHTIEARFIVESGETSGTGIDNSGTTPETPGTSENNPGTPQSSVTGKICPFTDVKETDWLYEDVLFVYNNGIMVGTDDKTFSPNGTATWGMMATILWRMEGSPDPTGKNPFTDVAADNYYTDAVIWAHDQNIFAGYDNQTFDPNAPITRQQLAAIFYRYAAFKGYDLSTLESLDRFTDKGEIADWAQEAVKWAIGNGLMYGTSDTTFDPAAPATRAQIAAMLHSFIEEYGLDEREPGFMDGVNPTRDHLTPPKSGSSSCMAFWMGLTLLVAASGSAVTLYYRGQKKRNR